MRIVLRAYAKPALIAVSAVVACTISIIDVSLSAGAQPPSKKRGGTWGALTANATVLPTVDDFSATPALMDQHFRFLSKTRAGFSNFKREKPRGDS